MTGNLGLLICLSAGDESRLLSMPQTTTRGQLTGFRPNSDNNSNNNYSIFIFPKSVSVLRLHRWSFLSTSALFHAAARCYVHQHLYRLFHLFGCKVIYLPVTSPHLAFSLTAPLWKLLHFSWSFPVISYFLVNFRELSMSPSMIQQDCQDECCRSW